MWVSMVGIDSIRDWLDDLLISFDIPPSLKATPLQTISHRTQLAWSCFVYFILFLIYIYIYKIFCLLFFSFYFFFTFLKLLFHYFCLLLFFKLLKNNTCPMAMWVCRMARKKGRYWGPKANCRGVGLSSWL
jgi:hypothetical protein